CLGWMTRAGCHGVIPWFSYGSASSLLSVGSSAREMADKNRQRPMWMHPGRCRRRLHRAASRTSRPWRSARRQKTAALSAAMTALTGRGHNLLGPSVDRYGSLGGSDVAPHASVRALPPIERHVMADNLLNLLKPVYTPPGSQGPLVSCAARTMGVLAIIFGGLAALAVPCLATDVRVVGVTPGQSADLVIGDGTPVTVQVGETIEGVKLLRASLAGAVVSEEGITETLPLVADGSSEQAAPSDTVRLSADA